MTRAFVAVRVPYDVLDAVLALTAGVSVPAGRMMTMQQWHLTLQFLGDRTEVGAVVAALDGFSVPGGQIRLGGAGAFPNARRGRVLWIGVAEGAGVVTRLADGVAAQLAPLGYEREDRPFRPHITLARCGKPTDLRVQVAALDAHTVGSAWRADELVVYESILGKEGARYVERATIALLG